MILALASAFGVRAMMRALLGAVVIILTMAVCVMLFSIRGVIGKIAAAVLIVLVMYGVYSWIHPTT
jgi:hypothetical protein